MSRVPVRPLLLFKSVAFLKPEVLRTEFYPEVTLGNLHAPQSETLSFAEQLQVSCCIQQFCRMRGRNGLELLFWLHSAIVRHHTVTWKTYGVFPMNSPLEKEDWHSAQPQKTLTFKILNSNELGWPISFNHYQTGVVEDTSVQDVSRSCGYGSKCNWFDFYFRLCQNETTQNRNEYASQIRLDLTWPDLIILDPNPWNLHGYAAKLPKLVCYYSHISL